MGIGTTTPASALEVASSTSFHSSFGTSTTSGFTRWKSNVGTVGYIGNGSGLITGAIEQDFIIRQDTVGTGSLLFATGANSEKMRITNAGNVGIGVTNPVYSVDVAGPGNPTVNIRGASGALYVNNISPNTGTTLAISGASVGIGTTSPGQKLDVQTASTAIANFQGTTAASYGNLTVQSNDSTMIINQNSTTRAGTYGSAGIPIAGSTVIQASTGDLALYSAVSGKNIYFNTNNSGTTDVRMSVTSAGNVGIGTTNPARNSCDFFLKRTCMSSVIDQEFLWNLLITR